MHDAAFGGSNRLTQSGGMDDFESAPPCVPIFLNCTPLAGRMPSHKANEPLHRWWLRSWSYAGCTALPTTARWRSVIVAAVRAASKASNSTAVDVPRAPLPAWLGAAWQPAPGKIALGLACF